ncbi:MAG TPA: abortive infection system antitoxin AbiGi family protein, partial [Bacteroidota bacterium]|nr:abortive infection system antitoxin AbiGi family protein [Bacteroidota bacterium]
SAWREGKCQHDLPFYDEREWRFVPPVVDDQIVISRAEYQNADVIRGYLAQLRKKYTFPITPDDIQYLIVPDDSHILKLIAQLEKLYSPDDAKLVTTAIMTCDRIEVDI